MADLGASFISPVASVSSLITFVPSAQNEMFHSFMTTFLGYADFLGVFLSIYPPFLFCLFIVIVIVVGLGIIIA